MMKSVSNLTKVKEEKIVDGLRIPSSLNNTASVNFVLTQEPGKLKPKDLKIAIEKNRAEREEKAEEQRKIRESGGSIGVLNLRTILSEEFLNTVEGDAYKRQIREMTFLADVEELNKQEAEKMFRISEDFYGSDLLSDMDIATVKKQRELTLIHKKRTAWRDVQARQHTELHPPNYSKHKAGSSIESARHILVNTKPIFDTNRNDIWAKRLNTLRRFIALVSRWVIRKRITERMKKITTTFNDNGAFTRQQVLEFIHDNLNFKKNNKSSNDGANATKINPSSPNAKSNVINTEVTVAKKLFESMNERLEERMTNEQIITHLNQKETDEQNGNFRAEMVRRVLFPKITPSSGGKVRRIEIEVPHNHLQLLPTFDDRTVFQLKNRPDYETLQYQPFPVPKIPVYYPEIVNKTLRTGAPEEQYIRSAADANVDTKEILGKWMNEVKWMDTQALQSIRANALQQSIPQDIIPTEGFETHPPSVVKDDILSLPAPKWLEKVSDSSIDSVLLPRWDQKDVDYTHFGSSRNPLQEYRVYAPHPLRCEMDRDWRFRPTGPPLLYTPDNSIRTSLLSGGGARGQFATVNSYLLRGQLSANRGEALSSSSSSGPTISDYFMSDQDRHPSGLHCFVQDHLRGAVGPDPDHHHPTGHNKKLSHPDDFYLTDSESDNEEDYGISGPSMAKVRKILRAPPPPVIETAPPSKTLPGKAGSNLKVTTKPSNETKSPTNAAHEPPLTISDGVGDEEEVKELNRREEQVELLRDRKTLDVASTLMKENKMVLDRITNRLVELSKESSCSIQALPVQLPFHRNEEEVYKWIATTGAIREYSNSHIEQSLIRDSNRSNFQSSTAL